MKNIVVFDEYNEIDLKPSELIQEYVKLTEQDVENFFIKGKDLKECSCPACHDEKKGNTFTKFGLKYAECKGCGTVYATPRPNDEVIAEYYKKSAARTFWYNEFSKTTGTKRKEKIIKPRLEWIVESVQEYLPQVEHYVDINTTQFGYVEELVEDKFFKRKTFVDPFLPEGKFGSMGTSETLTDVNDESVDVVSIFEAADHVADIDTFFKTIKKILTKNGLLFMTDILISGFDMWTLWNQASNLYPPDRLNVFSVKGLRILFERHGFECLEFSTPGIFDVEIVNKAIKQNPEVPISRFMKHLVNDADDETKRSFQEFLQSNLMSSYGRIVLRKTG